uniref:Uncharacterized protein n=1 Tax=viral metagenome TaxID=1070528 RepID=A0A6M3JLQ3_9ZZZZ
MRTNRDRKITSGFEEVDRLLDKAEATGDLTALGKAEQSGRYRRFTAELPY